MYPELNIIVFSKSVLWEGNSIFILNNQRNYFRWVYMIKSGIVDHFSYGNVFQMNYVYYSGKLVTYLSVCIWSAIKIFIFDFTSTNL